MLGRMLNNWALKLLSLAIALTLWAFLMGERRLERGYTIPLELANVPSQLLVANDVPSQLEVRLAGPSTRLAQLDTKDLRVRINLQDLKEGLTSFRRLDERLTLPSGVRVTRIYPSFVEVKLERLLQKTLPVKVALTGKLPEGVTLVSVQAVPDRVAVEGAASAVQGLTQVETDPVSLEGLAESTARMTPLHLSGDYLWLKDAKAVDVRVSVKAPEPAPVAPPAEPEQPVVDKGKKP